MAFKKMAKRRVVNVFSMAFLDAISCGFGAVVLLFMIIHASIDRRSDLELVEIAAEVDRMELKVLAGRKNLVQSKDDLAKLLQDFATLRGMRAQLVSEIESTEEQFDDLTEDSEARREQIEQLRADLADLQSETERLSAASITPEEAGNRIRSFTGDGNRQYLTGLRMGGDRVVILVDTSTSMLDRTLVNILRRRNMPPEQQRAAPKWRQVVNTVDWLTTQIPPGTQVQIIGFAQEATTLIEGSNGEWVTVTDGSELEKGVQALRNMVPSGPSSLVAGIEALRALQPQADNVYLLVDGLPTMGEIRGNRDGVTSRERVDHFYRAIRSAPFAIPFNVILFAMEGDPWAAPLYWELSLRSGGSMLAPSEDWP
jgi:hypothetical protein